MDNIPLLRKFAKAFQKLDSAFASVKVYTEYDDEMLGADFPITFAEFEEYHGRYVNALEIIPRPVVGDDPDIDIEYELMSIRTDEINYEYIIMLIQSFVPDEKDEYELVPEQDEKAVSEVNKYLEDLNRSNPPLASIISVLWNEVQDDPEAYRGQIISTLLEEKIQKSVITMSQSFANKWGLDPQAVNFYVESYNPRKSGQIGEAEVKATSDYFRYKEQTEQPVSRLKYKKTYLTELNEMVRKDILPLVRK